MDMCHGPAPADMLRGAYILLDPHNGLADCAVIFEEKDAEPVKKAALMLSVQGIAARLIAIRDISLFEKQDEEYRSKVLRPDLPLFAAFDDPSRAAKLKAEPLHAKDAITLANGIKKALFAE
ncbi:MAG: hypothetical protein IJB30_00055 [Clostridia bacterium]|nr:hypothetical protein [Clostridia bacterium]